MLTKHNSRGGGTHESKTCDDMQFKHSPHVIDLIIVSTRNDDVKLVILACFLTHHSRPDDGCRARPLK